MTDVRTTFESTPGAGGVVSVPDTAHARDGLRRVAAIAGIAAVAVGMVTIPLMGSAPVLGDSAEDIGAYFAGSADLHRLVVVIGALLAIPMVLFFAGVHWALVVSSGRSASAWATVFLYGAIMMSATAGLKEALYAFAVRYAATEPDLSVLALVSRLQRNRRRDTRRLDGSHGRRCGRHRPARSDRAPLVRRPLLSGRRARGRLGDRDRQHLNRRSALRRSLRFLHPLDAHQRHRDAPPPTAGLTAIEPQSP